MSTEQNKAGVREWVERAWNNGDTSSAQQLYAAGYEYHDPQAPGPVRGAEGIAGMVAMFRAGLPDIHMTIEDMVAVGDTVAWRFSATATHLGPLFGIPATGRAGGTTGILITRFSDGKWAEDYCVWDTLGLLQDIGAVPRPEAVSA